MKLTKEIISVLKYHGFLTFTAPAEKIIKDFNTFEDLCTAGLISDRAAVTLVHSLFNDDGVNEVASAEPEVVEEPVEAPVAEPESEVVEEPVEAPVAEPESEAAYNPNPEVVEEPAKEEETVVETPTEETTSKPSPKKKTPTKKTTKKES